LGLHEQAISLGLDCTGSRFNVGDVKLDPGGEVFWGPMAYVIIGGLVSATLLTLFFLPALYVVWFRIPRATGDLDRRRAEGAGRCTQRRSGVIGSARSGGYG
jgi:hypothetical protein